MERMRGEDAVFIHFERMGEPCHTLKVVVLDPGERGRPVTLHELRTTLDAYLPLYPRARQRVVSAPALRGLPFWVDDPDFDLDLHVSERVLPAPGGPRELDDVCSSLASSRLDLARPLWDATLVHGMESGHQAVVVRLHHAVSDGMGVVRLLERVTSDSPQRPPPPPHETETPEPPPIPSAGQLTGAAIAGMPHTIAHVGSLLSHKWRHRRAVATEWAALLRRDDLRAGALSLRYTWLNERFGTRRLCATGSLPLADLVAVKEREGGTLNGVLLAVIAGALRRECERRERDLDEDIVCGLGMSTDPPGSSRMWGNDITTLYLSLHTTVADPLERLRRITRSASDTVQLRRGSVEGRSVNVADVAARLGPVLGELLAYHVWRTTGHLAVANVPGPATTRYVGDVRISALYSFAINVLNSGMNITVYRYGEAMNVGILVAPEVHRRPDLFMEDLTESLAELVEATADL